MGLRSEAGGKEIPGEIPVPDPPPSGLSFVASFQQSLENKFMSAGNFIRGPGSASLGTLSCQKPQAALLQVQSRSLRTKTGWHSEVLSAPWTAHMRGFFMTAGSIAGRHWGHGQGGSTRLDCAELSTGPKETLRNLRIQTAAGKRRAHAFQVCIWGLRNGRHPQDRAGGSGGLWTPYTAGKAQHLVPPYLPNPRGAGQAVAPDSGPRSGRLRCYEDGDPAASAASPRNAALPALSLGRRIHCGQGPHREGWPERPRGCAPFVSLDPPARTTARPPGPTPAPHGTTPTEARDHHTPRRGATRAYAHSPTRPPAARAANPAGRSANPAGGSAHTRGGACRDLTSPSPLRTVLYPAPPPRHPSPAPRRLRPLGMRGRLTAAKQGRDAGIQMKNLTKLAQPSNFLKCE